MIVILTILPSNLAAGKNDKPARPLIVIRKLSVDNLDRSSWVVADKQSVRLAGTKILGIPAASGKTVTVDLVTFDEDNTPFLREKIINRPVWQLRIHDFSFQLKSSPSGYTDPYTRMLDAFLDPATGEVLKIRATLPTAAAKAIPEPTADYAVLQISNSGNERYHDFAPVPAEMTFMDAVDAVQRAGFNPLSSVQVEGLWVLRSVLDREPRPMWIITLRGMPPIQPSFGAEGIPIEARNHLTAIVDPVLGICRSAGNVPQPIGSTWQLRDKRDAVNRAGELIGTPLNTAQVVSAELSVLFGDRTPFLREQSNLRTVWNVRVADFDLVLKSPDSGQAPVLRRPFAVCLDGEKGHLISIASPWPKLDSYRLEPPEATMTEAEIMPDSSEKYTGFITDPPKTSFSDALGIIESKNGMPSSATQIIGKLVEVSRSGRESRPSWVITFRGVPRKDPTTSEMKKGRELLYRSVVDAETGELLSTTDVPAAVVVEKNE